MMSAGLATVIGKSCEVKGAIIPTGGVRVDGNIEGGVISEETVIVGENAVVKGDIRGSNVVIAGRVNGDVTATEKLEILHTGRLYGDIITPKIAMAEGVVFEGTCEMEKHLQESAAVKK